LNIKEAVDVTRDRSSWRRIAAALLSAAADKSRKKRRVSCEVGMHK